MTNDPCRCLSGKPQKDLHFKIESDRLWQMLEKPCLIFLEMATSYFAPIHSQAEKPHVLLCRVSKIGHAGDIQKHITCVCLDWGDPSIRIIPDSKGSRDQHHFHI